MKRWIVIVILLLTTIGLTQDIPKSTILDFSPGLVTSKGILSKRFDEASIAWNLDLTRVPRHISPRRGYSERATLPLVDSILWNGLFAAKYRDGTKEFLVIAKWKDSAWAGLFASDPNEFGFGYVDSVVHTPDTGSALDSCRVLGAETYCLDITIDIAGGHWLHERCFDTTTTRATIVDTFVAVVNASGAAVYVTAYDLGDSLAIEEDDVDYNMALSYYCNPFDGGGHCASWLTTDHSAIDSASVVSSRISGAGVPHFAQHRDKVYVVNGTGRGHVYTEGQVGDFPMRGTGEPQTITLTTAGNQRGTYHYAFSYGNQPGLTGDSSVLYPLSTLSRAINSNQSGILVYGYPRFDSCSWVKDTMYVKIWRSLGDIGSLKPNDSLYLVDSVLIEGDAEAIAFTYIDTVADATIRARERKPVFPTFIWWPAMSYLFGVTSAFGSGCYWAPDTTDYGDTNTPKLAIAPGTIIPIKTVTAADSGIWQEADDWEEVVGFSWVLAPVDTNTRIVGDTGRSLWMWQPIKPASYTADSAVITYPIGWPHNTDTINCGFARSEVEGIELKIPEDSLGGNVMYALYRGPVIITKLDSVLQRWSDMRYGQGGVTHESRLWYARSADVPAYYYIGTYYPGEHVIDTLRYDSLILRDIYQRNAIPSRLFDVTVANNRLVAIDEKNVYFSDLVDSAARFDILHQRAIQPDDGDQNTAVWQSSQGVVRITKAQASFSFFQSNGIWQLPELSAYYGMVAPLSRASAPEGDYFLSTDGVRLEQEGIYKGRSYTSRLVSTQLANFKDLDMAVRRNAIGISYDNKYILSMPDLDSTFVLNKIMNDDGSITYGWTQWSFCPVAHTFYRVAEDNIVIPGDTLYFTLSGDSSIYSFGSTENDNGVDIVWKYKSGPTNPVTGDLWYPHSLAMYLNSTEENDYCYVASLMDDRDNLVASVVLNRLDTIRYYELDGIDTLGGSGALFWQLYLQRVALFADTGVTNIQAIWFEVQPMEPYGSQ